MVKYLHIKEVQGSSEATIIFQPQNSLSERVLVDGFCSVLLRGVVINWAW